MRQEPHTSPPPRLRTLEAPLIWVNHGQTLRTDRLVSLVNFSIFHLQHFAGVSNTNKIIVIVFDERTSIQALLLRLVVTVDF
jgi:hypothetical protein